MSRADARHYRDRLTKPDKSRALGRWVWGGECGIGFSHDPPSTMWVAADYEDPRWESWSGLQGILAGIFETYFVIGHRWENQKQKQSHMQRAGSTTASLFFFFPCSKFRHTWCIPLPRLRVLVYTSQEKRGLSSMCDRLLRLGSESGLSLAWGLYGVSAV